MLSVDGTLKVAPSTGPEEGYHNWSGQEVGVVKENAPLIDVISIVTYSLLLHFVALKQMSYYI